MIRSICVVLAFWAVAAQAQECRQSPRMHALDFWIGRWDVSQGGQLVGTNTIESTLNGCAILEHWRDVAGGEGTSLFYYDRSADLWKQVWITDHALRLGGTKEKLEQKQYTSSSRIRFQGIDRTTLTREADGKVRQLIESPTDGGKTWRTTFDAIYQPSSSKPGAACSSSQEAVGAAPRARSVTRGARSVARARHSTAVPRAQSRIHSSRSRAASPAAGSSLISSGVTRDVSRDAETADSHSLIPQ